MPSHAILGVAALAGNTKGKRPKTRTKGGSSVCDRLRVTSCGRNFVSTCVEILLVALDTDIGIGPLQIENIPSSLVLWDFTRAYLTQRQLLWQKIQYPVLSFSTVCFVLYPFIF